MGSILTQSQSRELHKAIIGYLSTINAHKAVATLQNELSLSDALSEKAYAQFAKILEKKWTSNTILQKRIMTLEAQIDRLNKELQSSPTRSQPIDPTTWLPTNPTHILKSHRAAITCIAFHPKYSSLASSSEDYTIKIWDWELGELEKTFRGHTGVITALDYGGQKSRILLASASNDLLIKLWDPSNGYANIRTLSGHDHSISSIRFLQQDKNILVSASRDASIRLWDVETGVCVSIISTTCDWIRDVAPSFDGKWLVSCGRDHAATVWDVASGSAQAVLRGHGNYLEACAFAPPASYPYLVAMAGLKASPNDSSGAFIATAGRDRTVKLWLSHGVLVKTLVGHDSWVRDLVFHPGGRFLLSVGDDRTVRCWDLAEGGRLWKTLENVHDGFVSCVRWVPCDDDGDQVKGKRAGRGGGAGLRCVLATGSADSKVRVFAS